MAIWGIIEQVEASFTERNGFGQRHHRIGRALPARIVTNDELSEIVDTTDEWIVPRTGIHTRHVAIEETCTDLGRPSRAASAGA